MDALKAVATGVRARHRVRVPCQNEGVIQEMTQARTVEGLSESFPFLVRKLESRLLRPFPVRAFSCQKSAALLQQGLTGSTV